MIQTCHLKKIKAATRNEQFFVFWSSAADPFETFGLLENIAHQRQILVAKLTAMFATE